MDVPGLPDLLDAELDLSWLDSFAQEPQQAARPTQSYGLQSCSTLLPELALTAAACRITPSPTWQQPGAAQPAQHDGQSGPMTVNDVLEQLHQQLGAQSDAGSPPSVQLGPTASSPPPPAAATLPQRQPQAGEGNSFNSQQSTSSVEQQPPAPPQPRRAQQPTPEPVPQEPEQLPVPSAPSVEQQQRVLLLLRYRQLRMLMEKRRQQQQRQQQQQHQRVDPQAQAAQAIPRRQSEELSQQQRAAGWSSMPREVTARAGSTTTATQPQSAPAARLHHAVSALTAAPQLQQQPSCAAGRVQAEARAAATAAAVAAAAAARRSHAPQAISRAVQPAAPMPQPPRATGPQPQNPAAPAQPAALAVAAWPADHLTSGCPSAYADSAERCPLHAAPAGPHSSKSDDGSHSPKAGHSQQPEQSTAVERRRESARRNRKRKADYLAGLEEENVVLRTEVGRLQRVLRAWATQGFVTPDQALEFLASAQSGPPASDGSLDISTLRLPQQ